MNVLGRESRCLLAPDVSAILVTLETGIGQNSDTSELHVKETSDWSKMRSREGVQEVYKRWKLDSGEPNGPHLTSEEEADPGPSLAVQATTRQLPRCPLSWPLTVATPAVVVQLYCVALPSLAAHVYFTTLGGQVFPRLTAHVDYETFAA